MDSIDLIVHEVIEELVTETERNDDESPVTDAEAEFFFDLMHIDFTQDPDDMDFTEIKVPSDVKRIFSVMRDERGNRFPVLGQPVILLKDCMITGTAEEDIVERPKVKKGKPKSKRVYQKNSDRPRYKCLICGETNINSHIHRHCKAKHPAEYAADGKKIIKLIPK